MKKFSLIIIALALMTELSQCRKPIFPTSDGETSTRTITLTTNYYGDEKGSFFELGGKLKYKWDNVTTGDGKVDKLYVYAQDGGETFVTGKYAGAIGIVEVSTDGYTAKFEGGLKVPKSGVLRFIHYGQGINVDNNGVATVDFSTQYEGSLDEISSKVVAICDKSYKDGDTFFEEGGTLIIQFAVAKLKFADLGDGDITVGGMESTGFTVGNNGNKTPNSTKSVTLKTPGSKDFYVVFMPTTGAKTYDFSNATVCGVTSQTLQGNKFYTGAGGNSLLITPIAIAGEYTVNQNAGTKVKFSRGNLYYDASDNDKHWKFETNQLDYRTYSDGGSTVGYAVINGAGANTPTGDWGLFGWSTNNTGNNYGMLNTRDDTKFNGSFNDWGNNTIYDNGTATTGWRTLSNDEWMNLIGIDGGLSKRDNAKNLRAFKTIGGVLGIVILPDGTANPSTVLSNINTAADLASSRAVFFPAGGCRYLKDGVLRIDDCNTVVTYWSSTVAGDDATAAMMWGCYRDGQGVQVLNKFSATRYIGYSVRLAR